VAGLLFPHYRNHGLAEGDNAKEIGLELTAQFVERHVFGKAAHAEARVVNQRIDTTVIAGDVVEDEGGLPELGHIEAAEIEAVADAGFLGGLVEASGAVEIAHGGDNLIAVARELNCREQADSAGTTCNYGDFLGNHGCRQIPDIASEWSNGSVRAA